MLTRAPISHRSLLATAVLAAAALFPAPARAFRSTQKTTVSAGVVVGGIAPQSPLSLKLSHVPLIRISDVTKVAIIQGEIGEDPKRISPSFATRFTPLNAFTDVQQAPLRIRLRYRVVPPDGSDPAAAPVVELDPLYGPDPMGFAFELPRQALNDGQVEYQLIAERIERAGGAVLPIETVSFPEEAKTDPNAFHRVGVEAAASETIGKDGGRFVLYDGNPNDGATLIDVPANFFASPTRVALNEIPSDSPFLPPLHGFGSPVAVYQFSSDQKLPAPLRAQFLYPDFSFANGGQRGLLGDTDQPEDRASVVAWDGYNWRHLGGTVNANDNTVSARISNFQYFAIVAAGAPQAADARPVQKVITPNSDGINDAADFNLGGFAGNVSVEIFNVSGRKVRTLSAANPSWDARDDDGHLVESGVYLYQYKVNGELISGLVAVAK